MARLTDRLDTADHLERQASLAAALRDGRTACEAAESAAALREGYFNAKLAAQDRMAAGAKKWEDRFGALSSPEVQAKLAAYEAHRLASEAAAKLPPQKPEPRRRRKNRA